MDNIDPKPGYQTTEFWVTMFTIVITAVAGLGTLFGLNISKDHLLALVPTISPLAAGAAAWAYSLSRSKTKAAHLDALVKLNTAAPSVVSHGVVNVTNVPAVTPVS